jgi:acetyl esterase/lipase
VPWIYLVLSLWGALFVLAAVHPSRNRFLLAPTFFMSWMTIELAAHHLVLQWVATLVFWRLGAFSSWPGWVGLGIAVVSWIVLIVIVGQGRASARTMRDALEDLGPGEPGPRVPGWLKVLPFSMKRRRDVEVVKDIEFARVAGRSLRLDVYHPRTPGERRPAVLQIHGGGWVIGDKREQGIPLLGHLVAAGWVGFNANYRLSPGATFPDHLVDLKRALAWIREHAAEYGADPDFVCVTGGSAGGHLAALMALTANDPRYQPGFEGVDTTFRAAVPFYGVYDFTNRNGTWDPRTWPMFLEPWVVKAFLAEEPERFAEASPIDQVSAAAPPFLVIHGDRDTLAPVEDARTFVEALRSVSSEPVIYAELHGSQHAFDIFPSTRSVHVIEAVERFLRAVRDGTLPADESKAEAHVEEKTSTPDPAETLSD